MPKTQRSVKQKQRDIQRLLNRNNLHADTRVNQERKLNVINHKINLKQQQKNKEITRKSLHKIRIFEFHRCCKLLKKSYIEYKDLTTKYQNKNNLKVVMAKRKMDNIMNQFNYICSIKDSSEYISIYGKKKNKDAANKLIEEINNEIITKSLHNYAKSLLNIWKNCTVYKLPSIPFSKTVDKASNPNHVRFFFENGDDDNDIEDEKDEEDDNNDNIANENNDYELSDKNIDSSNDDDD